MKETISIMMMAGGLVLFYVICRFVVKSYVRTLFGINAPEVWRGADVIFLGTVILFVAWMAAFQFPYNTQRIIRMPTAPNPEPTQAMEVQQDKTDEAKKDADAALMQAKQLFNNSIKGQ